MAASWQNVHVFISSTFNDMHAERDYLVKQVFPRLREWCEQRKLRLIDIDLRWGVTEEDATLNKRVVQVCLERIDICRPFFLCFLGQRRGWVPQKEEIAGKTFEDFPGLYDYIDPDQTAESSDLPTSPSVTEMEIMHAVINPLHRGKSHADGLEIDKAKYAFFYLRDDHYLVGLPAAPVQIRHTYTNEGIGDPQKKTEADQALELWRNQIIPKTHRPINHYNAVWNTDAVTPELAYPITCPSTSKENILRWRARWAEVGVTISDHKLTIAKKETKKASAFNLSITKGRLTSFTCEGTPLSDIIFRDLTQAITERFPEHMHLPEDTPLQREMDQQDQFLQTASDGFIQRQGDFDRLNEYLEDQTKQTYALIGSGGLGKSTLLAKWIDSIQDANKSSDQVVLFRFIGASDASTNVYSLLHSLLKEFLLAVEKPEISVPLDSQALRETWIKIIQQNNSSGRTIIVLDAINQLEDGLSDLSWLPWELPDNVKLVLSFKRGNTAAEDLIKVMAESGQSQFGEIRPFDSLNERRKLVEGYLNPYLKDLGEVDMGNLIELPGAGNPLYLKVLLSELRVFGVFSELKSKISGSGDNPVSAFKSVLARLEKDPAYSQIPPDLAVPLIFGSIAYTRHGLSAHEIAELLLQTLNFENTPVNYQSAYQTVNLYLRQTQQFLARRDGCYDFFYESFKLAAIERYTTSDHEESTPTRRSPVGWHHLLADYFQALPVWLDSTTHEANKRKTGELPFHLAMSSQSSAFSECLGNFDFLFAKILAHTALVLLEDFKLASWDGLTFEPQAASDLKLIQKAISLSLQNIDFDPKLFAGQLIARLSDSDSPVIQALVQHARCWTKEIWIRPLSTNYKKPDSELGFSFLAAGHYLHQMLVTADGKHLVTLGQDQERGPLRIKIWDARNGRLIRQTNLKDGVMHANIAVLSDSRTIVLSTITDFTFYNLENLSIQPHFPINGDTMGPHACFLKISPDGRYGYVIEQDILRALDFKDGKRLADLLSLGARMVLDFKFSRSGRYLALILGGGKSTQEGGRQFSKQEYYQTNSNDCLYVFEVGSNHLPVCSISSLCCDSLCFTPDDESLILVSEAGRVDLVNIADRKIRTRIESLTDLQCESAFRAIGHPFGPQPGRGKVEISLDGKKAICCVGLFYFEVLDITKDAIRIACSFSSPPMLSLATVGNSLAISSNAANEMNVWELYAGKMARRLQDNAEIRGFEAVVIDGQIQVFSRNNENYIRYWDLSDIAVLKTLSENPAGFMSSPVSALHVSPSGEVVCAVRTMYIEVIDMQSRQVLTYLHEPLSPTTRPMGRPYFLPDQSRLATVSGYTIDTWLYRSSIKEKSIQLRHIGAGCSVCSSELTGDGQWLVYSDSFNRLHMIHLATRDEYEFDCGEVLPQGISVYNEDLFVLKQTPVPWGRSGVTLLPDGNSVISFSYIPHVYGSQSPDHLHGKLETTEEFVEIHDLETGRLKRRFSDPDFHWYVHRFKARHAKELVFQWVAKKQRDVYGEMSEFCVESLNVQTGSRTTIISKPTPFMDFDITQDEQKLVVATIDGVIEVISVQSGQVITHFKGDQKFTCCVVAQDEKTIIVGDDSGAVNFLYLENDQEAEIPMPNTPAPSGEIASAWSGRVFPFLGIDGLPYTESQPLAGAELTPEQSIPPSVSRESTIPTEQTRHTEKPIDNSISHATAKEVDRKPLNRKLLLLLITIILVLTSIVAYMVYDQVIVPTPAVFRTPLPQTTRVIP